jgi:hypothetical protein
MAFSNEYLIANYVGTECPKSWFVAAIMMQVFPSVFSQFFAG